MLHNGAAETPPKIIESVYGGRGFRFKGVGALAEVCPALDADQTSERAELTLQSHGSKARPATMRRMKLVILIVPMVELEIGEPGKRTSACNYRCMRLRHGGAPTHPLQPRIFARTAAADAYRLVYVSKNGFVYVSKSAYRKVRCPRKNRHKWRCREEEGSATQVGNVRPGAAEIRTESRDSCEFDDVVNAKEVEKLGENLGGQILKRGGAVLLRLEDDLRFVCAT